MGQDGCAHNVWCDATKKAVWWRAFQAHFLVFLVSTAIIALLHSWSSQYGVAAALLFACAQAIALASKFQCFTGTPACDAGACARGGGGWRL